MKKARARFYDAVYRGSANVSNAFSKNFMWIIGKETREKNARARFHVLGTLAVKFQIFF